MNERSPLPEGLKTPPRGRVLMISPHADDDVIGCGGTLAKHAAQGDPVQVLIAYDGVKGDTAERYEPEEYRFLRRDEALRGAAHLGLSDYVFWSYPEGHVPAPEELRAGVERLAAHIRDTRPDLIYAPWIGEYHVDHHVLARAARLAVVLAGFQGEAWAYEVWTPLIPTRIIEISDVFEQKKKALHEHRSQIEVMPNLPHKALAITAQRAMYLGEESWHGEAFRPLGEPDAEDRALLEAR